MLVSAKTAVIQLVMLPGETAIAARTNLMQDATALFEACVAYDHMPALLVEVERRRRPGSDALQDAAISSAQA